MKEYLERIGGEWIVKDGSPLKEEALRCFYAFWGSKMVPVFPGPQPVSIERKHFSILKTNEYVVCEKTDGVRTALLAFMFGTKKVTLLINRALHMTYISLTLPRSAHKGTLLDCELIDKTLMVYDGIWVYGQDLKSKNLLERLSAVDMFIKGILRLAKDPVLIKLKKMVSMCDLCEYYNNTVKNLSHESDGLIFTPINEPIKLGTHNTMFKWKPRDLNTIDFQVKWTGNHRCALYVQEKGTLVFESEIQNPTPFMEMLKEDTIVECMYMKDEYPMWWKPVGVRSDKTYPNSRFTFYRTLVNIKEDIQWTEFVNL